MRKHWPTVVVGLVAVVAIAVAVVSIRELHSLRREVVDLQGSLGDLDSTQTGHSRRISRHDRNIADLENYRSPIPKEELALWKGRIDDVIESYLGSPDALRMDARDVERIIMSLQQEVGDLRELKGEQITERLQTEVQKHLAKLLDGKGLVLNKKRPGIDLIAGELALTGGQVDLMKDALSEAHSRALKILREPRDDGINLFEEFMTLENMSVYDPVRDARYWKLLRLPSGKGDLHQRLVEVEDELDLKVREILTEGQYDSYKAMDIIPTDVTLGTSVPE